MYSCAVIAAEVEQCDTREKIEDMKRKEERRKAETDRVKIEGPKVEGGTQLGKTAGRGGALTLGLVRVPVHPG